MKKIYTLLLLICCFTASLAAQDWQTIQTFIPGQTIGDIYVANDSTVYAVSALFSGGTELNIKKTIDNGVTWTQQQSGHPNANFRALGSPNGVDVFAIGNEGLLIRNNGTDTWSTIDLGITMPLRSIFFVNEDTGWIGTDSGIIFVTFDGGDNWADLNTDLPGIGTVANIYFIDEGKGFVHGFNYFRITENGGGSWTDVAGFENTPGTLYQLNDMEFVNDSVGYICGDVGLMYKTTDGGVNWSLQMTNTTESLQDLAFLSEDVGFAVGFENTALATIDGGENWEFLTTDINENLRAVDFTPTRGFVSSQTGKILALDSFMMVSSVLDPAPIEVEVYPNPVDEQLHLNVVEIGINIQEVRLYNLSGQLILADNTGPAVGETIDCSSLKPGMYFLRLMASDGRSGTYSIMVR